MQNAKPLPYQIQETTQYRKDVKKAQKRGCNITKLDDVINTIATRKKLSTRYRNHKLQGRFQGYEECHIQSDWLLIYKQDNTRIILILVRTGTHADIFEE